MRYQKEAGVLWRTYVPSRGQASTVQGELIRAVERLRMEAQDRANANWSPSHVIFVTFLRETLLGSGLFDDAARVAIERDLDRLLEFDHPETSDEPYDALTDRVVEWAIAHPEPVPMPPNPDLHI